MWFNGWETLVESFKPVKFDGLMLGGSGDIFNLSHDLVR